MENKNNKTKTKKIETKKVEVKPTIKETKPDIKDESKFTKVMKSWGKNIILLGLIIIAIILGAVALANSNDNKDSINDNNGINVPTIALPNSGPYFTGIHNQTIIPDNVIGGPIYVGLHNLPALPDTGPLFVGLHPQTTPSYILPSATFSTSDITNDTITYHAENFTPGVTANGTPILVSDIVNSTLRVTLVANSVSNEADYNYYIGQNDSIIHNHQDVNQTNTGVDFVFRNLSRNTSYNGVQLIIDTNINNTFGSTSITLGDFSTTRI